jgi:hypothetical protein
MDEEYLNKERKPKKKPGYNSIKMEFSDPEIA